MDLFIEKFMESCQKTCVADVPVGIFLSGGIDSSLVYSAYKSLGIDIQSFTVGFHDNEFDESRMARKFISNPDKYNELFLTADDVGQAIDSIFSRIDEPHGDPGLINAYLLTKFAKEKVNVGLTGDGADELFGGYATFHAHALSNKTSFVPRLIFKAMRRIIDFTDDSDGYMNFNFKLKRFLNGNKNRGMFRYLNWISCEENLLLSKLFTDKLIQKYVLSNNLDIDVLEKCDIGKDEFLKGDFDSLLNFYQKNFLSGFVCHHTDRASMLNSFEVRSPFLNKEIINFANTLHKKYKYNSSSTKYILRKALEKLGGTKELVNRKKWGLLCP